MIPVSQPSLTETERSLLVATYDTGQLTYGPACQEFERRLASRLGVKHALVTSSGTTALHLALLAAGIHPGDEVLVPDLTFVATANAVLYCGARPVLVDVHPDTWCIDLLDAARKVTPSTHAIIPVHLYGYPCDMAAVNDFAARHGLHVIEDAAEGLGGSSNGRPLGTIGDLGILSFYGNKIITTGEGGAVLTNNTPFANEIYSLRGQSVDPSRRYFHTDLGYNYRMTDLQASIGIGQLDRFVGLLSSRWAVFTAYRECLGCSSITYLQHIDMAPWLFTVLLPVGCSRDRVAAALHSQGIDTRPTFVPLHQLPHLFSSANGGDSSFPVATDIGQRGLSLPTFPDLSIGEVMKVSQALIEAVEQGDK